MMALRLRLYLLLLLTLTGCTLPNRASAPEEEVMVPAMSGNRATAVLPGLTPSLIPTATPISVAEATASALAFLMITPQPGYPAPIQYPTSYPEPLTPSPPTATPVPFPIVSTLPLTATWFYDADDSSGRCGYTLYALSNNGEIVELNHSVRAHIPRPEMPPLLLTCVPHGTIYNDLEMSVLDAVQGTATTLATNTAAIVYQWSSGILTPDGRYYIVDGGPSGMGTTPFEAQFRGMYRIDLQTGEVIEMLQYAYEMPGFYDQGGASWDMHQPLEWNAQGNGFTVFTLASMDTHLWHFQWDEDAPMPYSITAGSLTVESLDPDAPFPYTSPASSVYPEHSLPTHITRPMWVYRPVTD